MRKIISKHKQNRKQRRNQFILAGLLIFIMFFSVLGYSFMGRNDEKIQKINYNGFEFIAQNSFWFTSKGDLNFIFRYNPKQTDEIDSEVKYSNNYYGKPLYIYSENNEAELEIYKNLDQIVQIIRDACLDEDQERCQEDWPIKTCEFNFIIIEASNESNIIQEENCVFIYGAQENLTKITDEFLFKTLGIRG